MEAQKVVEGTGKALFHGATAAAGTYACGGSHTDALIVGGSTIALSAAGQMGKAANEK